MKAPSSALLRITGLAASTVLALSPLLAADAAKPVDADKDPLPVSENSLTLGGQSTWVSGDAAAFQAETWTAKKGFAGIEDFQLSQEPAKDVSVKADGHLLPGNEDYLAHIAVSKNEIGSFDGGYKRFRTFYDGVGGFFPSNNAWFPLADQSLHVDRSKLWAEAVLSLPNAPVVTVRFTNEVREGTKDSTIWGDTDFTGVPISSTSALNTISADRKIVASYLGLSENHRTLSGTVAHTIGNTKIELGVVGDQIDNLDTRYLNRYPGELKPFPAIPTTPATLVSPALANNAIWGYDQRGVKTNALTFTGKVETSIGEKITAFAGASFQHATTDIAGYRPLFVAIASTAFPVSVGGQPYLGGITTGGRAPGTYQNLAGGSKAKILTGNFGFNIKATNDLFIEAAVKAEQRYTQSDDSFSYLSNTVSQTTGLVTTSTSLPYSGASRIKETSWTPELNVRYTGIKQVSLYANADYRYSPGSEDITYVTTSPLVIDTDNIKENHGHYAVGANWVPCSYFNLRGETFYKDHRNSFYGVYSTAPTDQSQYVLGSSYYGFKLSVTLKPLPTLSATTRYVLQVGQMDLVTIGNPVAGTPPLLTRFASYDTMDARSHNIGETIDWTPIKQFYLQGNVNLVFDTTGTAYPTAGGAANDVLRNANNNHWTASVLAGFVVDKATNAEVQYTQYKASNYQPELYSTVPYGAGASSYTATVGVKRKLTDTLLAEVKIGYLSSHNDTTGGNTNYSARVAYVAIQQAF
jgi:hypothetical protein